MSNKNYEELVKKMGNTEYTSYADVEAVTTDTLVLNALQYVGYEEASFLDKLAPAPRGVYMHSQLFPLVNFDERKYRLQTDREISTTELPSRPVWNIKSFDDFITAKRAVVDDQGRIVCKNPAAFASEFRQEPRWSPSSVMVTLISATVLLRDVVHPSATVTANFSRNPDKWMLPEYSQDAIAARQSEFQLLQTEAIRTGKPLPEDTFKEFSPYNNPGVTMLLNRLTLFGGRDTTCVYRLRLEGSTLKVEKGYDYRILAYYKALFDKVDDVYTEQYGF